MQSSFRVRALLVGIGQDLLIIDTRVRAGLGGRQDKELLRGVIGSRAVGRQDEEVARRRDGMHFGNKFVGLVGGWWLV